MKLGRVEVQAVDGVRVVFSDESLEDLRGIWDFVAEESERSADRLVTELVDAAESLDIMPERFPEDPDIKGARRRNVRTWAIIYDADDEVVTILRIVHGGRDLTRLRLQR